MKKSHNIPLNTFTDVEEMEQKFEESERNVEHWQARYHTAKSDQDTERQVCPGVGV